ncbi:MAG: LPS export ABC transporter periplasmic protein LptC [Alphaproteobacteria bacterium]
MNYIPGIMGMVLIVSSFLLSDYLSYTYPNCTSEIKINTAKKVFYKGEDYVGDPFSFFAKKAYEDVDDNVILKNVNGTMELKDGKIMRFHSKKGIYCKQSKKMLSNGEISVHFSPDLRILTSQVVFDFSNKKAEGNKQVTGYNRNGVIHANGFTVQNDGTITFLGRPKLILF